MRLVGNILFTTFRVLEQKMAANNSHNKIQETL